MSILEYFDAALERWFFYMEGDRRAESARRWRLDGAHEGTKAECEALIHSMRSPWRS